MLQIKVMSAEKFMKSKCNTEQLKKMYMRLNAISMSKWAPRLDWGESPLYKTGNGIFGGGDCVSILSHREDYGYTLINVGDRGSWYCGIHSDLKTSYEKIAFLDGEFEEVFAELSKHFAKQESEKTWQDKLEEIKQVLKGYGKEVNCGLSNKEINTLIEKAEEELSISLPGPYIKMLKVVNGLEFNGYIIYGADKELLKDKSNQMVNGLINNNKDWYENEWQKKYLFLGDSSLSWYVYDLETQKYLELDKPSGDECQEFKDFDEMLKKILTDSLM